MRLKNHLKMAQSPLSYLGRFLLPVTLWIPSNVVGVTENDTNLRRVMYNMYKANIDENVFWLLANATD